ncbi:MAG TPA: TonB-dependent receptor [Rhodanobacter sp.]|nr:TonB-dependent receptor [Rhodanobacter sp.]
MHTFRRNALQAALLLSGYLLATPGVALGQDASSPSTSAGPDVSTGQADNAPATKPVKNLDAIQVTGNTVNKLAPSAPPLEAAQPTSVIDERFIRDALRMDSSYDDIVKYSPSITVTSPEGPGLGKNEGISLRGFQDGQFNVTFDGIPFGNAADLHHTTSAYFSNHVLGQAQIDRGPGGGATIGNATFGGTIALRSRNPDDTPGVTPYATLGSWDYHAVGVAVDGKIGASTSAFADVSRQSSETYLKGTDDRREHIFLKTVTKIGETSSLTFVTGYNQQHQNTVQGQTKAQVIQYGPRFGLGNDPSVQNYKGYNNAAYYSTFNYLGLSTSLGEWDIDNKVYYVSFTHFANKAKDASDTDPTHNGVTFYDADGKKAGKAPDDVSGKLSDSNYHAIGDTFRLQRSLGPGLFKTGFWVERDLGGQYSYAMDLTTGQKSGTKTGSVYNYRYRETDDTVQPYVQYDWSINDKFTLSPGLRYSQVTRHLNAAMNKLDSEPLYTQAKYSATLPSLTLHEWISDKWTAYAQVAKGFLAPPIDVIETVGSKNLDPETTTNYQIGTAYASSKLTFGADLYYINFSNLLTETEVSTDLGNEDTYINGGGAIYRGAEFEATFALTDAWSLYGNASYNEATYKNTSVQLAGTPKITGALGLLYGGDHGFYGSLMSKFTGKQYGVDNVTDDDGNSVFGNDERLAGFLTVDATIGYRSPHGGFTGKGYSISANINNLFNVHKLSEFAGTQKESGDAMYFGLPGRGVFIDLSMKL